MNKVLLITGVMMAILTNMFMPGCAAFKKTNTPPTSEVSAGECIANPQTGGRTVGTVLQDIGSATADNRIADRMRPFFMAGLAFVILGALTFAIGGKATGFGLMVLGIATTGTGVLFIQYPWTVLVVAVLVGVMLVLVVYDRWRVRKRLEGTETELQAKAEELDAFSQATGIIAKVVETAKGGKSIKEGIRELGPEAVSAVKKVISPIKEEFEIQLMADNGIAQNQIKAVNRS